MSEKYTSVEPGVSGCGGYGIHGHADPSAALAEARRFYEWQREQAEQVLAAIDAGNVEVFHQRGVYAGHDRERVRSDDAVMNEDYEGICGQIE
jgi:hypothetical protein